MGHIEENVERIAVALESIAETQTRLLEIGLWNRDRLLAKTSAEIARLFEAEKPAGKSVETPEPDSAPEEPVEKSVETPEPDSAPEEPDVPKSGMGYEELRAEFHKRGVEVKKGTKMSTLEKRWPEVKDMPVLGEPKAEEKPADELFDTPKAEEKPAKKPLTREEALKVILGMYRKDEESANLLKRAFETVGAAKFSEVPDGSFEKVIETYHQLKFAADRAKNQGAK